MSNVVISIESLSKIYRLGQIGTGTFTNDLKLWWARARGRPNPLLKIGQVDHGNRQGEEIWALRDVSFTVEQGEVLGIIGRNGAGKSTLLKILSRVTAPTSGQIKLKGRIASLLEVGTGFHPELTGRENIYLNGAILGMSRREIDRKFDEIVDFAEIEKFIDTPVKRYSSGMYVRLAFAVAAQLDPEILVVDEVLAVGDVGFQKKCLGKMKDVAKGGRTVLFVSHQMDMIRSLCRCGLLLENGSVLSRGTVDSVVDSYITSGIIQRQKTKFEVEKYVDTTLQILRGRIIDDNGREKDTFDVFAKIILEFEYVLTKSIEGLVVNFELKRNGSTVFISFDTDEAPNLLQNRRTGCYLTRIEFPSPLLKPGNYTISTNTGIINSLTFQHLEDILSFNVELQSKPSSFLGYAEKRKGIIAVPLTWHTEYKKNEQA